MKKITLILALILVSGSFVFAQAPVVNSFSPDTGLVGSTVTITGANFDGSSPANNQVFFGSAEATVLTASFGVLTVAVPAGSTTNLISVRNALTNLSGYSRNHFNGVFCDTPLGSATYQPFNNSTDPNNGGDQEIFNIYGAYNIDIYDMDGDGKSDIITGKNGGGLTIALNNSTVGTMNFIATNINTGANVQQFFVADFDGDGKRDIVISGGNGAYLYRNLSTPGNISFGGRVTLGPTYGYYQCAAGDIDGDGKIDFVGGGGNNIRTFRNTSSGPGNFSFTENTVTNVGSGPNGIQVVDVDGDGKSDIVGTQRSANRIFALRSTTSSSTFSFAGTQFFSTIDRGPYRLKLGDFDKDGKIDLVMPLYEGARTCIFKNTSTIGAINFDIPLRLVASANNYRVGVGDVNGDGFPDIVTKPNGQGAIFQVYQNTSSGPGSMSFNVAITYSSAAGSEVGGIAIGDMDGDYVPDIATSGISSNKIRFHRNKSSQQDVDPPTAICQDITVALAPDGTVTVTGDMIDNGSGDACGLAPFLINGSASVMFTCADVGTNNVVLTVTDIAGNTATCNAVVTVAPAAIIVAGQTTVCQGDTITLNANLGDSYQWFNNGVAISGATSQTYIATQTGDYTVQVINSGGCSGISDPVTATVNENPTVDVNPGGTAYICPNGTATLTASQSAIYQWMQNGVDIPDATQRVYNATITGNYSVRVIDLFGCTAVSNTVVVATNPPEIDVTGNGNYGNVFPNQNYTQTITISNTGTNNLDIENLAVSGPDAGFFTLAGFLSPSVVAPGTSEEVDVIFNAPDITTYTAVLTFDSNDCDEPSFTIPLNAEINCLQDSFSSVPDDFTAASNANCNAIVEYTVETSGNADVTYTFTGATTGNGTGTGSGATFNFGTTTVSLTIENTCVPTSASFEVTVADNLCSGATDLNLWSQTGNDSDGNWVVSNDGSYVDQTINGRPTFFVSPETFFNTTIEGTFEVRTAGDDDFIGFVFGYEEPPSLTEYPFTAKFYLFDWKQLDQGAPKAGTYLSKVEGTFNSGGDLFNALWGHTDSRVTLLGMDDPNDPNDGWADLTEYGFKLEYYESNIKIYIDDVLEYDVNGTFSPGKFGFYNSSQNAVRYSGFTQEFSVGIEGTDVSCSGASDGSATATPSSFGTPPFTYAWSNGETTQTIENIEAGTYTVTVTDGSCSECTAEATIEIGTVPDITPPTITCPDNISVNNDPGDCSAVVTYEVTFDDNCDGETIEQTAGLPSGSVFPVGTTTNTFVVTDAANNKTECSFDVTVSDTESPIFGINSEIELYSNDFENPNGITQNGSFRDLSLFQTINSLYGADWQNTFTVETILINGPTGTNDGYGIYTDPTGQGGNYSIGMLSTAQDDRLSLTFDTQGKDFLNVSMDLSAIDLTGNGISGSFGVSTPTMRLRLYDSPGGVFNISSPGTPLVVKDLIGVAPSTDGPFTFNWVEVIAGLDASGSTDGNVSLMFDMMNSGYASFDNLVITASNVSIEQVCVEDISIYTDPGSCEATNVDLGTPVTSDNCPDELVSNDAPTSFPLGTTTVTWTVTDGAGNMATCEQIVTVVDDEDPIISCLADVTVDCPDDTTSVSTGLATATDNCDSNPTITQSDEITDGSCVGNYVITRTWTATDSNNNSSSCVQTITVQDTTVPTIDSPANDVTVECDGGGNLGDLQAWLDGNGALPDTSGCFDSNFYWSNVPSASGNTATGTINGIGYTYTSSSTVLTTNLIYNYGAFPSSYGIPNQKVIRNINATSNTLSFDQPIYNPILVFSSIGGSNTSVPIEFSTDVTVLFAQNVVQNSSTKITGTEGYAIVRLDGVYSSISFDYLAYENYVNFAFGADFLVPCPNDTGASASDNCGGVTWTNDFTGLSDDCGTTGSATVTFTATDQCGNSSSTTATFTIQDTTNPTWTDEPADMLTVECDPVTNAGAFADWLASFSGSDSCGTAEVTHNSTGLKTICGGTGTEVVTFTLTDECNNFITKEATFTIIDTTNPTWTDEPADMLTVECDPVTNAGAFADWLASFSGSDSCGTAEVTHNSTGLKTICGGTGTEVVTFTLTDECNNFITKEATFTIIDTTNPTWTDEPVDMLTVECDPATNAGAFADWLASFSGSDSCGTATVTNDHEGLSDLCGGTGTETVTFTLTDQCGNHITKDATFTIEDTTDPSIDTHASDLTVECDGSGNGTELAGWLASIGGTGTASDTCSGVTWTNNFMGLSDDCGETGSATVIFTAKDACGNTSTTSATFTILDTRPPSIDTHASDLTVECDGAGNTAQLNAWLASNGGTGAASDICAGVTWSHNFTALSDDCGNTGSATVIFTAEDACGLTSTTTATFTIEDTTDPDITPASDLTVECDGAGNTAARDMWLANNGGATSSDDCSSITWSNDYNFVAACGSTGAAVVTFTSTDACGHSSSTTATFTIEDTTNPDITAASDLTVECDGAGNTASRDMWLANNGGATSSDDCSSITWSNDYNFVAACGSTGAAVVTFTSTDECNNSSSTTATFTIEDTKVPDLECPADISTCADQDLVTGAVVNWTIPVSTDICSSVTLVSDYQPGDTFPVGDTTVTYTATDECNNSTQCSFVITVWELPEVEITESELPLYCQENAKILTANIVSNTGGVTYDWSTTQTTDNIHVTQSGTYSVIVTDANGCTRETSYDVEVIHGDLISAYTILATEEVHLHGDNQVLNGGVGVFDEGEAKIHENTQITGATTFLQATDTDITGTSAVTNTVVAEPNVVLTDFEANPFDSDYDIEVDDDLTLQLDQQVYGKIKVKEGATVIFTQKDVFIKELDVEKNATVQFAGCAFVRVEKGMDFDEYSTINPDNFQVNFYTGYNVEVKKGSVVNASIYALDHEIKADGKEEAPTFMNGRFIAKKVKGDGYVNWDWNTVCDTDCTPGEVPVNVTCECDGGIKELTFSYAGNGADLTTNSGMITDNGDGTYTVSDNGEKLEKDLEISDGVNTAEIHTSCSDDILGITFAGEITVVAYTDMSQNTSTVEDCPFLVDDECECKDGMVELTFTYERDGTLLSSNSGTITDNGDGTYTITNGGEKIEKYLEITNGDFIAEIHTSCSQDILGVMFPGAITVVNYVDNEGNISDVEGCTRAPTPEECECEGGMVEVTFTYEGDGSDLDTNSGSITPNGDGTYTVSNAGEKLEKYLEITVGTEIAEIHTSCSQDILGVTFTGGVTVLGFVDTEGNIGDVKGCTPAVTPEECDCSGGMNEVTLSYGGGAGVVLTTNSGTITDNGDGTYTVSNAGEKLEKDLEVSDGINTAEMHTSCSQDILGVIFDGAFTVTGHTDTNGTSCEVPGDDGRQVTVVPDFKVNSWPNPSDNFFKLKIATPNKVDKVEIQVFDISNKQVHVDTFNWNEQYTFGEKLQSGVYFVRISQGNNSQMLRVIKY